MIFVVFTVWAFAFSITTDFLKRWLNVNPLYLSWGVGILLLGLLAITKLYVATPDMWWMFAAVMAATNMGYKGIAPFKRAIRFLAGLDRDGLPK